MPIPRFDFAPIGKLSHPRTQNDGWYFANEMILGAETQRLEVFGEAFCKVTIPGGSGK